MEVQCCEWHAHQQRQRQCICSAMTATIPCSPKQLNATELYSVVGFLAHLTNPIVRSLDHSCSSACQSAALLLCLFSLRARTAAQRGPRLVQSPSHTHSTHQASTSPLRPRLSLFLPATPPPRLRLLPSRGCLPASTAPHLSSCPLVRLLLACFPRFLVLPAVFVAVVVSRAVVRSLKIFSFKTCHTTFYSVLQIVFVRSVVKICIQWSIQKLKGNPTNNHSCWRRSAKHPLPRRTFDSACVLCLHYFTLVHAFFVLAPSPGCSNEYTKDTCHSCSLARTNGRGCHANNKSTMQPSYKQHIVVML